MKAAIFPGSFDPVTLGHLDIIERASRLFDRLIVVILENSEKHATFSMEERLTFLRSNTAHLSNVEVAADHGLTVDFARKQEAVAIVRGVRSVKDYEYELDIASVNQHSRSGMITWKDLLVEAGTVETTLTELKKRIYRSVLRWIFLGKQFPI